MADPVHFDDGKWWFYEETWADRQGPFDTEAAARTALSKYAKFLDDGIVDPDAEPI